MKLEHALIVPGGQQYDPVLFEPFEEVFRNAGISAQFVPIKWSRTVISQNVHQFNEIYRHYDPSTTVVFGFSAGAMISLIAAADRSPAVLILASLAAWFAEDVPHRSQWYKKAVGHRRVADYKNLHFSQLAPHITSETYILLTDSDSKRWPQFEVRAHEAQRLIKNSELIKVPNIGHDIGNPKYVQAVAEVISKLVE